MSAFVDTNLLVRHLTGDPPELAARGAHLVLSGHTHGGQINVRGITDRIFRSAGRRARRILALAAYLLWPHPRPLAVRLLPAGALILNLIHFAAEGYRWQMIPIYIVTALLGVSALVTLK